jgi:translation initiation factor IF-1
MFSYRALKLPAGSDVLATAVKMFGFARILVRCQDGKERCAELEEN